MPRIIVLLLCLLTACSAGSGEGLDASGRPIGEAPDPTDQPTLSNIQARIFTPICVQCHVGAGAPQGLRLDSANSYNDLVGVPSREVPGLNRVTAFDPVNSYLYQKISGTAAVGGRMPLGGPPLPDQDIELVRVWISNGASPVAGTLLPRINKVLSSSSSQIGSSHFLRISATNELDASSVLASSFQIIERIDRHYGNDNYREMLNFSVELAPGNANTIVIRVEYAGVHPRTFKVMLGNSDLTNVLDLSGRPVEPYAIEWQLGPEQ